MWAEQAAAGLLDDVEHRPSLAAKVAAEIGRVRLPVAKEPPAELDEDLMALDARLIKAMAFEAVAEDFQPRARQSAVRYGAVFEATGGSYTGVNAASMMALSGDGAQARDYARRVLSSGDIQAGSPQARYYQLASTAEAHLLLGDLRAAQIAVNAAIAIRNVYVNGFA